MKPSRMSTDDPVNMPDGSLARQSAAGTIL
jgi:hypothetical protein